MAGKGGGAWKVAYADFVTAMMAFFLVMWIVSQEQKIKEAVSHYFVDPMGFHPIGSSDNPGKPGSLFESLSGGNVPGAKNSAMGKGRDSFNDQGDGQQATKSVNEWLRADAQLLRKWRDEAKESLALAAESTEAIEGELTAESAAALEIAAKLRGEFMSGVPSSLPPIYQDLIYSALGTVNWIEVSQDLMEVE